MKVKTTSDTFLHFTFKTRAKSIQSSSKLLMNPPGVKKRGIDAITAVSLTYGDYVPKVQTDGLIPKKEVVAIVFKTNTIPSYGYVEEIIWHNDVSIKSLKVVSFSDGVRLLKQIKNTIEEDVMLSYY